MHFLIFLGSVRDSTPPRPARLGMRVSRACETLFKNQYSQHTVEIIDPLNYDFDDVFKPEFAYHRAKVPAHLRELADKIKSADGYVMVSPEYNHSMSPALANMLNHFGSSLFSYKPSAIVTYSAGQWGGVRAAVSMRTFLSELGCLPVSAMIHIPKAQEVFDEQGVVADELQQTQWDSYMNRTIHQLIWWSEGASQQRERLDPTSLAEVFKKDPSQRNAP
ncbi:MULTISPECIES: NADPH-dependent FMN reductase [Vibrio]|uniref:NADPH-dependent oxidoreductase n=1 Tax=Vibrio chemaguriensis TaxID=2527672 RepID=A0ABX1HVD7_9VIBR|nr:MULTISPECIES: NAD(P)H-dependent oxidoreductase [Vibrio]RCW24591.1 NAD(P)H-dependent FMN reductase [Vibrio parahaemolyticus]MCA2415321.1 NAD(P)H-dependent oxidoreductase [Vibrio chemaguriensis]MCA2426408.1 NAD(P)H-dependent oxidoreductase [Vibrio chemaguriensis]MCG6283976.1 NAD(P)H-dependent oxidoreductase [Vibrio diabolicus]MCR9309070.1 NAD(P)H-dependent oxidoreductase [Vibrio diabolicus]